MKGRVGVEVSINGIRMKGDEDDNVELRWNQLEACIRRAPVHGFMVDQHTILDHDLGLP